MSEKRVIIFDTTLRDGEQSPGASMSLEGKLQIASAFQDLGVDILEAGFPAASPGDFEAVSEISKLLKKTIPCGLARAVKKDLEKCVESLNYSKNYRIHTFISTSDLHIKHKLQKTKSEVLDLIKSSVEFAKKHTDDVEWSPEDATRTDPDYLCKTVELAIKYGATTINIPDTVGYSLPKDYENIIKDLFNRVPNIDKVVVSTHTHNDLGLAVANALAGVNAGARQIECTINGIGERAGNAALEEVVMAMKTRNDLMPFETNIITNKINSCSKLLSNIIGFPIQYNKAIVGKNAFAHESGIHQDGMLKNSKTYEIMTPDSVGVNKSSLVMGKHSGRHAFKEKLTNLGYINLIDDKIDNAFKKFKQLADKKRHVFDEDIAALVDDDLMKNNNVIKLISLDVIAGTKGQKAKCELEVYGEIKSTEQSGDGPVDSIFKCIKEIFPHDINLQLYQVHAVTEGTDAQATVSVRIEEKGRISVGQAADTDTLVASAQAYINALNKLILKRKRSAPSSKDYSAAI
ncbi:MAG: 2-isopropylmalate synthase [Candidatus Pelagibacter sp.]|nr:2-isopropylmalate synthase [Candidatus Pelagibacter sp.]|tara:strand:+ start:311 stop:1864 length:1554 start_codon:yes stop_codon:yes gene_type:complete